MKKNLEEEYSVRSGGEFDTLPKHYGMASYEAYM